MVESHAADGRVPPLVGELPPQCRRDFDSLRRFIHSTIAREGPAEAVSPSEFREVLISGATGFVGRFLLRELLRQHERLIVHPIVAKVAGFCSDSGAGVERCESMAQVSFESCVSVH